MSGFHFPPPPPPPPKPAASPANVSTSHQGNDGRGRGRGRGRAGQSRVGYGHMPQREQIQRYSAHQPMNGPASQHGTPSSASGTSFQSHTQDFSSAMTTGLPPGSYINHAFQRRLTASSTNVYSNKSHDNHASNHTQFSTASASGYPKRDAAGQKRKLDALRGSPPQERKSKPPTAPSVPSFGATLAPFRSGTSKATTTTELMKRSANVLGLTPQDGELQYPSDSEGEEEGLDEEAMCAELGSNLTFEHNGAVLSLKTAADLVAWKAERAKNFPTKARMAAKLEEKRHLGEERHRLLTEASEALRCARTQNHQARRGTAAKLTGKSAVKSSQGEMLANHDAASHMKPTVLSSKPATRTSPAVATQESGSTVSNDEKSQLPKDTSTTGSSDHVDPVGKPADDEHVNDEEMIEDSDKASTLSDNSSDVSSESYSSEDSDDGPPEETTSKASTKSQDILCRYFLASGYCRDGDSCRYKHELPAGHKQRQPRPAAQQQDRDPYKPRFDSSASARKSIHDRLLEQEQSKEEELALQVIKYLGTAGLFAKKQ